MKKILFLLILFFTIPIQVKADTFKYIKGYENYYPIEIISSVVNINAETEDITVKLDCYNMTDTNAFIMINTENIKDFYLTNEKQSKKLGSNYIYNKKYSNLLGFKLNKKSYYKQPFELYLVYDKSVYQDKRISLTIYSSFKNYKKFNKIKYNSKQYYKFINNKHTYKKTIKISKKITNNYLYNE